MHQVELFIALLVGAVVLEWLAGRLQIPHPVLLVIGGLAVGLLPLAARVEIDPDIVLLVFLPPLLYSAAFRFASEDVRLRWQPIGLLAVGLVAVTVAAVAAVGHVVVGLDWPAAFILGAILGPTDPVAATTVLRRLGAPGRTATTLEGESLINDGTALTAFKVAVGVAGAEAFSAGAAALEFTVIVLGGIAAGAVIGYAATWMRRRLHAPPLESTVAVLTAYGSFAGAERIGVSGILAVVVAGFIVGHARDVASPETRVHAESFWATVSFIAETTLFVLIGVAFGDLLAARSGELGRIAAYSALVAGVIVAVRLVWMYTAPYVGAAYDRLRGVDRGELEARERLLLGVSAMRGAVSVAAALAVPASVDARDTLVLVTSGVVLLTLVPMSLALPALVRRLGFEQGTAERRAYVEARVRVAHSALAAAERMAGEEGAGEAALQRARESYEMRIARLRATLPEGGADNGATAREYRRVRRRLLEAEREALEELSDEHEVRGDTLRAIRRELDLEDARLGDDEPRPPS